MRCSASRRTRARPAPAIARSADDAPRATGVGVTEHAARRGRVGVRGPHVGRVRDTRPAREQPLVERRVLALAKPLVERLEQLTPVGQAGRQPQRVLGPSRASAVQHQPCRPRHDGGRRLEHVGDGVGAGLVLAQPARHPPRQRATVGCEERHERRRRRGDARVARGARHQQCRLMHQLDPRRHARRGATRVHDDELACRILLEQRADRAVQ